MVEPVIKIFFRLTPPLAILVLSLSSPAGEPYEGDPTGGAASSSLSAGEGGLIASIANRKAADQLMDQAWSNVINGVKSLNIGQVVTGARQGARSLDADDQSKEQARWAMQALNTENDTHVAGLEYRQARMAELRKLESNSNSKINFVRQKASQYGVKFNSANRTVSIPFLSQPIPLGASTDQINGFLSNFSGESIANTINGLAHKYLGINPSVDPSSVKNQIAAGLAASDAAIHAVAARASAEAQAKLKKLGLPGSPGANPGAVLTAAQTGVGASGETATSAPGLWDPGENDERLESYRNTASLGVSPWSRLGVVHDDIFKMVSRRYNVLKSDGRVIGEDDKM